MVLDNLDVLCLVGSVTTAIEFAYTLAVPNTVIIRSPQLPQLVVTFAPDWAEQFASFMCHTFHATLSSRPWRMSLYGVRIGTAAMIAFISSINSVSGDGISETPAWYSFILLALRFVFAVLVSIESFLQFSTIGHHVTFLFVYLSWVATAPCGYIRDLMLRVVVVLSYFSAGRVKITIGALQRWCQASNLRCTLSAYTRVGWIPAVNRLLHRAPDVVLVAINYGTVALECLVVPALLVFESPSYRCFVALSLAMFHLGVKICTGILFETHLLMIFFALLPYQNSVFPGSGLVPGACGPNNQDAIMDTAMLIQFIPATTLVFLGLPWAFIQKLEGWPLNSLSLFPFNATQVADLQAAFRADLDVKGTDTPPLRLLVLDQHMADSGTLQLTRTELLDRDLYFLATNLESDLPSVFTPGFHRSVSWDTIRTLANHTRESRSTESCHRVTQLADAIAVQTAGRAQAWIREEKPFRSRRTGAALGYVRAVRVSSGKNGVVVAKVIGEECDQFDHHNNSK